MSTNRSYRETTKEAKRVILETLTNHAVMGVNAADSPLKEEIDHQVDRVRIFLGL